MNSIYFKNFIVTAGLVLISFLMLGIAFIFLGRTVMISEKRDSLSANANEVVKMAQAYGLEGDLQSWNLRMSISAISIISGNHIFICDTDGVVISCSDMELVCPHLGQQMSALVMNTLGENGRLDLLSDLGGFYPDTRYIVAVPIPDRFTNEPVGYVFISAQSGSLAEVWDAFFGVFFVTALIVLLIAVILSYITSKRQAKPINEMASAARRFAHGDFSVRVAVDGDRDDEIGELTTSFNAMAESLEKSEELRREFIANVSHELKTPMTTISGFADGLLDGTIPRENQEKYLATISDETKRLSRLVRRMLELSRIQAGASDMLRLKDFDVSEILRRTLVNLERKITSRNLNVDAQLPEESMVVLGDGDAITQVIYNLLDNAIKFSEPESTLSLALWKEGSKAFVSVKNQGETISEGELPLIFDRFHKTDRSRSRDREGVGLGLYIVKTILNQHDEDIFVTSRNGVTEFVFTLTLKPQIQRNS